MFLIINRRDPQAHTPVVHEITEELILEYLEGDIDIYNPLTNEVWCGNLDCPDWTPLI